MTLTLKPAIDTTTAELCATVNSAFDGYLAGSITMDTVSWADYLASENIDLNLSMLAMRDGEPVGVGMIARQGWTSRLAMMGIVKDVQETGVGQWLLRELIAQSRDRGDRAMELECFEQNPRGVRLYDGAGFKVVRRLMGYALGDPEGADDRDLTEVDVVDVARMIMQYGVSDLPWQVSGTGIARLGPPYQGYRLGQACAVISNTNNSRIAIRALIVSPEFQRQGQGTRLLRALFARFPGKTWRVPQMWPEEYGFIFEGCGFTRMPLNQYQMRLTYER